MWIERWVGDTKNLSKPSHWLLQTKQSPPHTCHSCVPNHSYPSDFLSLHMMLHAHTLFQVSTSFFWIVLIVFYLSEFKGFEFQLKYLQEEAMAATLMAATSSTGTVLKPTPFLGQNRGTNANPLRDVVSMGAGKYTMVLFQYKDGV